jgi:hypothetical protein
MVEPRHYHWVAAKHVLIYLHGTVGYGLRYVSGGEVRLQGYTDSDWVGSAVDRLSTLGCCFNLRSITISRKQVFVALSTVETEYITTSIARSKAVWLQKLLAGLHPRHDAEGSSKAPVSRDNLGVMQKDFLTEREC